MKNDSPFTLFSLPNNIRFDLTLTENSSLRQQNIGPAFNEKAS